MVKHINDLPNEILSLIFLNINASDLCKNVILTCKNWKLLIDSEEFWNEKLMHDFILDKDTILHLIEKNIHDSKRLYFKNPLNKNLIKNPCAEQGFDYWDLKELISYQSNELLDHFDNYHTNAYHYSESDQEEEEQQQQQHLEQEEKNYYLSYLKNFKKNTTNTNEMNGFKIEIDEHGSELLHDEKNKNLMKYATSYYKCSKYQIIDLEKEGLGVETLNILKPKIQILDNYAPRFDCGSEYFLRVGFYDENYKKLDLIEFEFRFEQWNDKKWHLFQHTVESYPQNLRYIIFQHGGKDTQFWAGHYGVKITNSQVKLRLF